MRVHFEKRRVRRIAAGMGVNPFSELTATHAKGVFWQQNTTQMTKTRHFTRHQRTRGAHRFLLDHIRVEKLGTTLQQTQCNPLVNVILLPRCLLRGEAIERNALIRVCCPNDSAHIVLVLAEDLHITIEQHHDNAAGVVKRIPSPFPQNHRVH